MSVIAVGDFDGVHLGHRHLLAQAVREARAQACESIVVTFDRNTKSALHGSAARLLTVREERDRILSEIGIDRVVTLPFTEQFRAMSPESFLTFLRNTYACTDLFGGEDFRFGVHGSGSLSDGAVICGIRQHVVTLKKDLEKISSSAIRADLLDGRVGRANERLGAPYSVCGPVREGRRLGRTVGFPTLNLCPDPEKLLPKHGVYVTLTEVDGAVYPSLSNVGVRPTVSEQGEPNVETHLLGVQGDFYGKSVCVRFLSHIRDERRFDDLSALTAQMEQDRQSAQAYHSLHGSK